MARQAQYRHPKRRPAGIPRIFGGNGVACSDKNQASRRKSPACNIKVAHCGKLPFGVFPQPLRPLMMENSPSGFFHNHCTFIFLYITKEGRAKGLMENSPSGFFHSPQGLCPSVASRHSPHLTCPESSAYRTLEKTAYHIPEKTAYRSAVRSAYRSLERGAYHIGEKSS